MTSDMSSPLMATKTKTPPPLDTGTRLKRQRTTPRSLEVHVVEDHADVLEHLYDSIGVSGEVVALQRFLLPPFLPPSLQTSFPSSLLEKGQDILVLRMTHVVI